MCRCLATLLTEHHGNGRKYYSVLLSLAATSLISCSWPSDFLCGVWLLHFLWAHAHNTFQPANLDHLFLRQAHRTADHLVAIQTQIDGAGIGDPRWLQDSGADIDAMSAKDLATIDPNLLKNLAPDHHAVHAANGHQL